MSTCKYCFRGRPEIKQGKIDYNNIYCTVLFKRVNPHMTSCYYFEEREEKMSANSKPKKRQKYRTSDDKLLLGYWVCEVVGVKLLMVAKRPYEWDGKNGMAVRVKSAKDKEFILEVTQSILVRQLKSKKFSDLPYWFSIKEKTSENNRYYYEIVRD